jgi:hypothetical protein
MKKAFLVLTFSIFILLLSASAQKNGRIDIKTSYIGILEGYDHINKTQLFIDGSLAGESPESLESKPCSLSVEIPRGNHEIYIVNLASYEGKWEEHSKANNYSIDAFYRGKHKVKKKMSIDLTFDIDKEVALVKISK